MGLLFCLFDFVLFACFLNRKSLYNSICPLKLSGIRKALPASQALIHVCVHVSLFVCYVDIKLAPNMLHKVSLYTKMRTKVLPKQFVKPPLWNFLYLNLKMCFFFLFFFSIKRKDKIDVEFSPLLIKKNPSNWYGKNVRII